MFLKMKGLNSSVGSVLGPQSCGMQHCGFDPPPCLPVKVFSPLELTWVLTQFPETLLDESVDQVKV